MKNNRELLKRKLQKESKIVSENSLYILREFEEIEYRDARL